MSNRVFYFDEGPRATTKLIFESLSKSAEEEEPDHPKSQETPIDSRRDDLGNLKVAREQASS